MNGKKTALKVVVAAAALAIPVGLSLPAQAKTSQGCTVTPSTPYANGDINASGVKMVDYPVSVSCAASQLAKTVYVKMDRWEQDTPGGDDLYGTSTLTHTFPKEGGSITWTVTETLPNWDGPLDNYAEVYQGDRFAVKSNGVKSKYTAWDYSGLRSIRQ
jgi:hypothetical protein